MDNPRVVIVGAGFGGLWAARALAGKPVSVTLIDRNNYHTFLPLLYQVAAAELGPEQIAYPVRRILRNSKNVEFFWAEVADIDTEAQFVETAGGEAVPYDYLILAPGSTSAYFGIPGVEAHTLPLKDIEDGITIRNQIMSLFEGAAWNRDPQERRRLLTFTIVGGGPTGVEFAGALMELIQGPLAKDFRHINFDEEVAVILLEMVDHLLPGMPLKLGRYAERRLRRMGVDVRTGTEVTRVTPTAVQIKDGDSIATETVIWTAGVRGHPLAEMADLPLDKKKRVPVQPTLQVPEHPNVYVVGDLAAFEEEGEALPMLAPVAMQQGEQAAANILRQERGEAMRPFHYRDRGQMATIGRNAAVADIYGLKFTGFLAWIIWLVIHLYELIGFRNRLIVLINWAWSYLFFERMIRLILPEVEPREAGTRGQRSAGAEERQSITERSMQDG